MWCVITVRDWALWILNAKCRDRSTHSRRRVGGHVEVHRLQPDPARPGEPIEDEVACATEQSGAQSIDLHVHSDTVVAVDPTPRFDIDLFTGGEDFFEDVAVAVQPD